MVAGQRFRLQIFNTRSFFGLGNIFLDFVLDASHSGFSHSDFGKLPSVHDTGPPHCLYYFPPEFQIPDLFLCCMSGLISLIKGIKYPGWQFVSLLNRIWCAIKLIHYRINNSISLVAAGNSVIFAPHPAAKKVTHRAITVLNEAIAEIGGPAHLLTTVAEPSIEIAQQLFKYPGIDLLVVTGGEAVVEAARKNTNKRLMAAGAGNPPVVVDETADIPKAARDIVWGASFDNNIVCADEKIIISVDKITDQLMNEMEKNKAVRLTSAQAEQLAAQILENYPGTKPAINRKWVGKDAAKIAATIGLNIPPDTRLLFTETDQNHPFAVLELMMPVIPVVRVPDANTAIDVAIKLERGLHHTAAMHSKNIDNMHRMANEINTSVFVKNGPCLAGLGFGGEGWTSMTITTPTGEGVTSARTFVRLRRCVVVDHFRIV